MGWNSVCVCAAATNATMTDIKTYDSKTTLEHLDHIRVTYDATILFYLKRSKNAVCFAPSVAGWWRAVDTLCVCVCVCACCLEHCVLRRQVRR